MCFKHDDQYEQANARVVGIMRDDTPDSLWVGEMRYPYVYRLSLLCRHIGFNRLDAEGGPTYPWVIYPWNTIARYISDPSQKHLSGDTFARNVDS